MGTYQKGYQLARVLYKQKKYQEAEKTFSQTVQGQGEALGKDHRNTLGSKYWLARTLYDQKKYQEAEKMFLQTVQGQEKTLGKDHKDTLDSKYMLGLILYDQEKYQETEEIVSEIVQGQEETLGKDYKDTLISKYWLAQTLYDQKKYQEAEKMFFQTMQGREKTLGKDHEDTLNSKYMLGLTLYDQKKYQEAEEMFSQTVQGREKALGKDHRDTLDSKYMLGLTLYDQKKYQEAEEIFSQAVQDQEETLGKDHQDTLDSKNMLGVTLYDQKKYQEAEEMFFQTMQGREKTLSKDHEDTLISKYWLARTLHDQKKYQEAEKMFSHTVQGREKALGKDHRDTLDSKYMLGLTLYNQKKYQETEEMFSEAVQGQGETLGKDHEDTLISKYWLARTIYDQKKYQEAEKMFFQTMQGRKKTLGKDHEDTLDSKYMLGMTLYDQKKYQEAEEMFSEAVQGQEETLGKDHEDTLISKYWLARTLYDQKKYQEAEEMFFQTIQGREKTLGKDHKDTLDTKRLLQEVRSTSGSRAVIHDTTAVLADRLSTFFPGFNESRPPYNDKEIFQISALLRQINFSWSRVPRTYILLRTIDCLHLLGRLIDLGFSDYWFPVTKDSVPDCLSPKMRARFLDAQKLVLTKSIDLEKSEGGQHHHFERDEPLPFQRVGKLGSGGFGEVDKVLSLISFREYARKRVPRKSPFGGRGTEALNGIIAEIEIMKKLKHDHVVEFVGSYTDPKYLAVIMSPVAEQDLSAYLEKAGSQQHVEIRTFFGCLATGLQFLHDRQIRHKDIKPGNILVDRGNILFTDFGLARDFEDASGSTTEGIVNGLSRRYCAPEVALQEPRNTSSDIWCLGVVFLEMIVVLKGRTRKWMDNFFTAHGSRQIFVRLNPTGLGELLAELKQTASVSDNEVLVWIQQMLQEKHTSRPTAASLVTSITRPYYGHGGAETVFCGICCRVPDDELSDTSDDLVEEQTLGNLALHLR